MDASKNTGRVRPVVKVLGFVFYYTRVYGNWVLYVCNFFLLVYCLLKLHPFWGLLILSTSTAMFSFTLFGMSIMSLLGLCSGKFEATRGLVPIFRYCFYTLSHLYGRIFHGYEIYGTEHLDKNRAGLIVFYHSLLPVDIVFVVADVYRKTGRTVGGVAHREAARSFNFVLNFMKFSGSKEQLVNDLKAGEIRAVSPGGEREALFSHDYEVLWAGRVGFAKLAKELRIPVYPLFTTNGRESMPVTTYGCYDLWLEVFEKTRQYVFLIFLMLPVKLRSYIGKPLYCREDESAEEFADRVKKAIEKIRDTHQRKPVNVLAALLDRF